MRLGEIETWRDYEMMKWRWRGREKERWSNERGKEGAMVIGRDEEMGDGKMDRWKEIER